MARLYDGSIEIVHPVSGQRKVIAYAVLTDRKPHACTECRGQIPPEAEFLRSTQPKTHQYEPGFFCDPTCLSKRKLRLWAKEKT